MRALDLRQSYGCYFGLFPFLNPQPPGSSKTAAAFDGNLGDDFSFAEPPAALERPWTPDVASTTGFRLVDDEVVAVHQVDPDRPRLRLLQQFQRSTLAAAPVVAQWIVDMGLGRPRSCGRRWLIWPNRCGGTRRPPSRTCGSTLITTTPLVR